MTDFIKLAGLDNVPAQLKGAQVAIGNFDGFHRGHQHVFAALKERARQRGVPAVVLTFEPHPRDVFAPEPFMFRLTEGNAKARLAEALGLDGIVIMPFTRDLSQVEAEDWKKAARHAWLSRWYGRAAIRPWLPVHPDRLPEALR